MHYHECLGICLAFVVKLLVDFCLAGKLAYGAQPNVMEDNWRTPNIVIRFYAEIKKRVIKGYLQKNWIINYCYFYIQCIRQYAIGSKTGFEWFNFWVPLFLFSNP